jgi:hypothetical protein
MTDTTGATEAGAMKEQKGIHYKEKLKYVYEYYYIIVAPFICITVLYLHVCCIYFYLFIYLISTADSVIKLFLIELTSYK